jgi:hypothetical protein
MKPQLRPRISLSLRYYSPVTLSFEATHSDIPTESVWTCTGWLKKMDSISYGYTFWSVHHIWMIYITFERGGPEIWNTTARAFLAQWISSSTMDMSHREWRHGASFLSSKISWFHTLRPILVGVRKRSSTTSTNNFGWPKKPYHNCGKLSDARHPSSGMGWIQLPSWCYPCGRRGAHSTCINFIVSIIKYTLHHICHYFCVWYIDLQNWVNLF